MRLILALPLLLTAAACNVESDSANDHMSLQYDENRIKEGAAAAARTAREIGSGVGNVASSTGRAISNEVGDIDVDVDVNRTRRDETTTNEAATR